MRLRTFLFLYLSKQWRIKGEKWERCQCTKTVTWGLNSFLTWKFLFIQEILITTWYVSERSIVFSLSIRVFNGLKYGPLYTNPVIFVNWVYVFLPWFEWRGFLNLTLDRGCSKMPFRKADSLVSCGRMTDSCKKWGFKNIKIRVDGA